MNQVNQSFRNRKMNMIQHVQQTKPPRTEETIQKLKPPVISHHTTIEKVPMCSLSEFNKDKPKLEIPYTIFKGFTSKNECKVYAIVRMKIAECYAKLEKIIAEGIKSITFNRRYLDYSKEGKTRAKFYTIPTAVHKYETTNEDRSVSENTTVYGITDTPDDNIIVAMEKTTKYKDVSYECRVFKYANFDDKKDPSLEELLVGHEEICTDVIQFF